MTRTMGRAGRSGLLMFSALLMTLALLGCGTTEQAQAPPPPTQEFAMLDAYGQWLDLPGEGEVWQPYVAETWQPYEYGHWRWTDRGWMWVSYEPFGWVVYHYGNWAFTPAQGWVWVPGYEWAPCRVRWFMDGDQIGWSPLPPPGVAVSGRVTVNTWIVVSSGDFTRGNVGHYRLPPASVGDRLREPGDDRKGPDARTIEERSGTRLDPLPVETEQAGQRGLVRVRLPREDEDIVTRESKTVERDVLRRGPADRDRNNAVVPPTPAAPATPATPELPPPGVRSGGNTRQPAIPPPPARQPVAPETPQVKPPATGHPQGRAPADTSKATRGKGQRNGKDRIKPGTAGGQKEDGKKPPVEKKKRDTGDQRPSPSR